MSVTELVIFGLFWALVGMGIGFTWTRDYLVRRYQALLAKESERVTEFSRAYSEQYDLQKRKEELLRQKDALITERLQIMADKLEALNNATR